MKMDKQHRLFIPEFIREKANITASEILYLVLKSDDGQFALRKTPGGKMVATVKLENKKCRFIVPKCVKEIFLEKEIVFYIEEESDEIGISIFKESV